MAKKKVRKQKPAVAQHNTRHGADLGVPQEAADAFMALYKNKKLSQAQEAAQLLTDRYPESAFAWKALGTALLEEGNASAALDPLLRSYKLDERDVLTLTSLAAAYYRQGSEQKAIGYQLQAVDLQPEYGPAQYRLAEMLQSAGQHFKALEHAKKALELGYDELRARLIVGALQYQTKYFSEALKNYHVLENKFPGHPTIFNNLGNLYKDIGEYEKAERYYQKALRKNPEFAMAYSNTFFAKHYNPATTQSEIIDFATGWEKRFALPALPSVISKKIKEKPLRVGLISSGFRIHPVGQMIATALESSRSDIHFYAYSTNDINDHITNQIRNACKQWQQVRHLSQDAIAELIQYDQIDILIDLSGHGEGSCLQAISMRPAPLCVKWVGGLVNTMGLKSIDYLLSDSIETPEDVDDQYTEKLIRLPDDYICYVPCSYAPSTTSLPAIKNHYITLGCLNNAAKISTQLLAEWALLMRQLPQSRLLLRGAQYESQDFCQRLWSEMAEHGIEQERILLEGPAKHDEFLKTYQRIDIALDTWPYSGGLTTCEAMLMGVPVVTLPGPTFAGRHSATHLINAGLSELVTNSWDEYRQRVIELANDLPNLAVIRAGLRTILHYSPVCDAPRFANHFNNALRAIWMRYCEDKAPEALTFNKEGEMWFADEDKLVELPDVVSEEESEDQAFEWKFDEPIIVVDNAAVLPRHPDYPKWMASGHLAVISFDPASLLNNKIEELKEFGELHHYPHALLGDGQPATLYATLDAEKGSTLRPLSEGQLPEYQREKFKVLAELPINTVALDSIEGLSSVDMLVLDDLHDAMKVLENGSKYLKNTLLIQVKVAFQPTHERQPNLAALQHWASRNDFRFYCFVNQKRESHMPSWMPLNIDHGSDLLSAHAIFLPTQKKQKELECHKLLRLAYILSNFFNIYDYSYRVLANIDIEKARAFIESSYSSNEFSGNSLTTSYEIKKYGKLTEAEVAIILTRAFEWDCFEAIAKELLIRKIPISIVFDDDPVYVDKLNELKYKLIDYRLISMQSFRNNDSIFTHVFISNFITIARRPDLIRKGFSIIHIPYGTSISGEVASQDLQYDQLIHRYAKKVFVAGSYIKQLYNKFCSVGDAHVHVTGHPKWSIIKNNMDQECFFKKENKVFLWNVQFPRHNKTGGTGLWSTWELYKNIVLNAVLDNDNAKLIIRPHPLFFMTGSKEAVNELYSFQEKHSGSVVIDRNNSPLNAYRETDALISDASSVIYDFGICCKPIIYLRGKNHAKLHDHAFEFIKKFHIVGDTQGKIKRFVNDVCEEKIRYPVPSDVYKYLEIDSPDMIAKNIVDLSLSD